MSVVFAVLWDGLRVAPTTKVVPSLATPQPLQVRSGRPVLSQEWVATCASQIVLFASGVLAVVATLSHSWTGQVHSAWCCA